MNHMLIVELPGGEELFNDQQIVEFDHSVDDLFDWDNAMAFDDNNESSRKQNEPTVKSKVSNKGKYNASKYEDPSIENPGRCDEDLDGIDDDNMPNHPMRNLIQILRRCTIWRLAMKLMSCTMMLKGWKKIQGKIMPRPMKRLDWETEKAKNWFVEYAGNML